MNIESLLKQKTFSREELVYLLSCQGEDEQKLFAYSKHLRDKLLSNNIHLRGLIEISNLCIKDCLYCGIRKSNKQAIRYALDEAEILKAASYASQNRYGSIVLQGGERNDPDFVREIESIVYQIKKQSGQKLGITLSLGEQSEDTYRRWFDAGAHRYLLRIETSNEQLYQQIHPHTQNHSFSTRLKCLQTLRKCGYQTGTGVMIGLPFQTLQNLADDLLFFKQTDIDMVGMGPYLEHRETPLWSFRNRLIPLKERLNLSLHMVSCLRILMPYINIAATTALQAIEPLGREKALAIGANIIMPNITPAVQKTKYQLYENKPDTDEGAEAATLQLIESVRNCGCEIQWDNWGDSRHFRNKTLTVSPPMTSKAQKPLKSPESPAK